MPPEERDTPAQARQLAARIRRSRAGQLPGAGPSLRELIDEGRR